MRIGVDLDNTIVCYDALFHRLASERGLLPEGVPAVKDRVRDHLRATGREPAWTQMQGEVYGPRMREAAAFPGAAECLRRRRDRGDEVRIISHRTRHPYAGTRHDLHASARDWIRDMLAFPGDGVFLEPSAEAKLDRIRAERCDLFIDDLPEFLSRPGFPPGVSRVLFDPNGAHDPPEGVVRALSWGELDVVLDHAESAWTLARSAGLRGPFRLVPVPGGRNNRVYRLEADGAAAVVKAYFRHPGDPRDRLGTEQAFLRYVRGRGLRCVPEPLGADVEGGVGLYSLLDGDRMRPGEAGDGDVLQALDFFVAMNRSRGGAEARALPEASEACRTFEDHLRAVSGRLERLGGHEGATDTGREAAALARGDLSMAWRRVRDRSLLLARGAGIDVTAPIAEGDRWLSPSDFGFHNALRGRDGRVLFLDFEYAGWDDPAKAVCDLFSQPDVHAPLASLPRFVDALVAEGADRSLPVRVRALLPVHLLKWSCLALSGFLPLPSERRRFSGGGSDGAAGLGRARSAISRLEEVLAASEAVE